MPERVGGMDRFFWSFDERCKSLGHNVVWFFPNIASHGRYNKLKIINSEGRSLEEFFYNYIKNNHVQFDTVFTHFLELCTPFYKKVKAIHQCKIIAVDHNPRPPDGYPLKKKIKKKVKGFLFQKYIDLFVGVSEYTVIEIINDFGSALRNKTTVVYNGISCELFQKRVSRALVRPVFLVASHLRYSKGIQDLIFSVSKLPLAIKSEIKIDIYGEGEYRSKLEQLIISHNLEHVFTFKGSVPNLFEIYCNYDYLLQPTHMECFSLAILESLSANVPVITTPVGGNEEVIQDGVNGLIVPINDSDKLSQLLYDLFSGKKAILTSTNDLIEQKFSIEKMADNYIRII